MEELNDYKQQAIDAENKRKKRMGAVKTIQKGYRKFKHNRDHDALLMKSAGMLSTIISIAQLQRVAAMLSMRYKQRLLADIRVVSYEYDYNQQVKQYLNRCATKIQKKWKEASCKDLFIMKFFSFSKI